MKNIITSLIILLSLKVFSCTCSPIKKLEYSQKEEFKYSDYVLIGEVIEIDNKLKIFKVKVKEVFKGNLESETIIEYRNHMDCPPIVKQKSEWLIYSKMRDNKFEINRCGTSRDLNNLIKSLSIPPLPPPLNDKRNQKEKNTEMLIYTKNLERELSELTKNEINRLRKLVH